MCLLILTESSTFSCLWKMEYSVKLVASLLYSFFKKNVHPNTCIMKKGMVQKEERKHNLSEIFEFMKTTMLQLKE